MSRSKDRKCYYARWSEPILRRRYSMHLVPTSEEETSSIRRSRSSSPLLNSLKPTTTPSDPATGCCSCHISRSKKKSSKSYAANNSKKSNYIRGGSQQMRENLEIQLVGSQVEEALAGDKEAALIQHLELATNVLEALIQHLQSLQISHVSVLRVVHLAHRLTLSNTPVISNYNSSASSDFTTRLRQAESQNESRLRLLHDVIENCTKNIKVSKQLQSLIDDHRVKKEDFIIAARNFKKLLENSQLTVSQMDKLQWQYQAIMDDYKQNRRLLYSELPKIIKNRLSAIRQGFSMIAAYYDEIEYTKQISDLLKILDETLGPEDQGTSDNQDYGKLRISEICEKCKVNKVEKK